MNKYASRTWTGRACSASAPSPWSSWRRPGSSSAGGNSHSRTWWGGSRSRCARCRFCPRTTDSPRSHRLQNRRHEAMKRAGQALVCPLNKKVLFLLTILIVNELFLMNRLPLVREDKYKFSHLRSHRRWIPRHIAVMLQLCGLSGDWSSLDGRETFGGHFHENNYTVGPKIALKDLTRVRYPAKFKALKMKARCMQAAYATAWLNTVNDLC